MQHDRNRCQLGFVANQQPQLVEGPTVAVSSLGLAACLGVGAFANARQVFKHHHRPFIPCRLHNVFANLVIDMPLESSRFARQPFPELTASAPCTPRALRGFALKSCPHAAIAVADTLDRLPRPTLAPRGCVLGTNLKGNVGAPQVNPNGFVGRSWGFSWHLDLDVNGVGAISVAAQLRAYKR